MYRFNTLYLFLIGFLSRIPFIFNGFGKEEDAWSQMLAVKKMHESGIYEISRLPGHPLFEAITYLLWYIDKAPWLYNGLIALSSAVCLIYFYKILLHLRVQHAALLTLTFNFIPVFFIAGTYTIDYNLALLLILASWYQILKKNYFLAGILIGLATGVRVSSLGFLVVYPFFMPKDKTFLRKFVWLSIGSLISVCICFYLPFASYGVHFIDFHKPPVTSLANVLYKLSFGIWGVPLLIAMGGFIFKGLRSKFLLPCIIVILLQAVIFFRLPFKSEFFIPALPFIILTLGSAVSLKMVRILALSAIASCFLMGFDYGNKWRGNQPSAAALTFTLGNKQIIFDMLRGPVQMDQGKRTQKSKLALEVITFLNSNGVRSHITAGWYYPEIMFKIYPGYTDILDYYSTKSEIIKAVQRGDSLYYLPEINEANAAIYNHNLLDSLAKPINLR